MIIIEKTASVENNILYIDFTLSKKYIQISKDIELHNNLQSFVNETINKDILFVDIDLLYLNREIIQRFEVVKNGRKIKLMPIAYYGHNVWNFTLDIKGVLK